MLAQMWSGSRISCYRHHDTEKKDFQTPRNISSPIPVSWMVLGHCGMILVQAGVAWVTLSARGVHKTSWNDPSSRRALKVFAGRNLKNEQILTGIYKYPPEASLYMSLIFRLVCKNGDFLKKTGRVATV